jgi:hypothetical protein
MQPLNGKPLVATSTIPSAAKLSTKKPRLHSLKHPKILKNFKTTKKLGFR